MIATAEAFSQQEAAQIVAWALAARTNKFLQQTTPGELIQPHKDGQMQALCCDKIFRILIPGNGWGKTTCMAKDADMLMQRDDPFKPQVMPKPDRPTDAVWFCQKYQQYEIMRPAMEALFTRGFQWKEQKKHYLWPNGSRLFLLSSDSDWTSIQGIELDGVYFDEHPDRKFWNEMMYRRRGKKKTRYMVAATMTLGITWFVTAIIQAWEKYCRDEGLTNTEALDLQPHNTTFIWNVGGIENNPVMDEEDYAHYESITTASEKERHVRLKGGYADFTGMPVFWLDSLLVMEKEATEGENGAIKFVPDEDKTMAERLLYAAGGQVMGHRFYGAKHESFFKWQPEMEVEGGRITIFEPPDPEQMDNYLIGADFAAGLEGKDFDAAIVGLKTPGGQCRQVAEAVGHWGDIFFAEVLYALGMLYFEAFIVGERQFGLPCLRRLYDEMDYTYLYHQRRESSIARRHSDLLGHHRGVGDTIIADHRLAIRRRDVMLLSTDAITQHKRYQFKPRNKTDVIDDIERSSDLTTGAPSGEFDDLVMAGAYLTHGSKEVIHYKRPKRIYKPGSFGDVMGLTETLHPKRKKQDPYGKR